VHISTTIDELRLARSRLPNPVGFVPTMGYLHAGHTSLVRQAKVECASVVASIFVNPTQFGPQEDFAAYPRDLERDLALLEAAGCELVWTPTPEIMYPPGYQTWITLDEITQSLEGAKRPGHFRGVATVVAKLFIAVQPQRAYFGQKDAQQAAVIRRMARDLDFPIDVIACPTVREPDGLAMSSRNTYLNPAERQAAIVLYRSLQAAKALFIAGSHIHPNVGAIQKDGGGAKTRLYGPRRCSGTAPDYVRCARPGTIGTRPICLLRRPRYIARATGSGRPCAVFDGGVCRQDTIDR
jgi:pantoate--beta-alanine ligase